MTEPSFRPIVTRTTDTTEYVRFTAEGGLAIRLTNKTGAPSIKGYLVTASNATANSCKLVVMGEPDIVGVFYESGVADGSDAWIVVSGIAEVYFSGNTTLEHFARNLMAADGVGSAGQAISEAVPVAPFATDKHFMEIGHVIEARVGAGLAKIVMHFN